MSVQVAERVFGHGAGVVTIRRAEFVLWGLLLTVCNLSLLQGAVTERWVFFPDAVIAGEWGRVFLASFTHVSWYHLALDAAAFLLLWRELREPRSWGRMLYFAGCWLGSLALPLLFTEVYLLGLCGLSGIAHGLFAVVALEMSVAGGRDRSLGALLLAGLLLKVGWELLGAGAGLSALHFGDVGVPIVSSHLGGVLGGMFAFGLVRLVARRFRDTDNCKGE